MKPLFPIQSWQAVVGKLYFIRQHDRRQDEFVPVIFVLRNSKPTQDSGLWNRFISPKGVIDILYDHTLYVP